MKENLRKTSNPTADETVESPDLAVTRQELMEVFSSYQKEYDESGNPVFAWIVIEAWCHAKYGAHPDIELPRWCLEYLGKSSHALNTLAFGMDFSYLSGESDNAKKSLVEISKIPQVIPQALGLCRRGWSAFRDFRARIDKRREAWAYYELMAEGMPQSLVMEQMRSLTGLTDDRHVRRRISEGCGQWQEGETSP